VLAFGKCEIHLFFYFLFLKVCNPEGLDTSGLGDLYKMLEGLIGIGVFWFDGGG